MRYCGSVHAKLPCFAGIIELFIEAQETVRSRKNLAEVTKKDFNRKQGAAIWLWCDVSNYLQKNKQMLQYT